MKTIIKWFTDILDNYKRKQRFKKKIKQLKKNDPFIYKH